MRLYNKIMLYFWLSLAVITFLYITFMGLKEGFKMWAPYYIFSLMGFMMYFFKRFMMKRMERHLKFLNEQEAKNNSLK